MRFSVVVPAYNEAASLPATLDSLRRQDLDGGFEVIVVDNGSRDPPAAVAAGHGARVVVEPGRGVGNARQTGVDAAHGEIVVSTDADTTHPADWLRRIDRRFQTHPEAVAVAGPCRYADPPWWGKVFPAIGFGVVGSAARLLGRPSYVTATNLAFRRTGFVGYDTTLTQGGDEVDLLRRLVLSGQVVWDAGNVVDTSSRRFRLGLVHTVVVSYGYYYVLSTLVNRLARRRVIGVAPAIRPSNTSG
ncbi:MAG: glycosyltransferase family 2 protein [Microlunatus sp.]|nr:glycosyltransferase family 2 protein [Microlunatus sp.]